MISGEADETSLIKFFTNSKKESNKDQIFNEIQEKIKNLDPQILNGNLDLLKKEIKQIALEARLNDAGIKSPLQIEKFQKALNVLQEIHKELSDHAKTKQLELIGRFPRSSPNFQELEQRYGKYKENKIEDFLKHNFIKANSPDTILNGFNNDETILFQQRLNTLKSQIESKIKIPQSDINKAISPTNEKFNVSIRNEVNFLKKWEDNFANEMVQGLDNQSEALEGGICFGLCQDIQLKTFENPEATLDELSSEQLSTMKEIDSKKLEEKETEAKKDNSSLKEEMIRRSTPRFLQGVHTLHLSSDSLFPDSLGKLSQFKVREENSFVIIDYSMEKESINEAVKKQYGELLSKSEKKIAPEKIEKRVEEEFGKSKQKIQALLKKIHKAKDIRTSNTNNLISNIAKNIEEGVKKGEWESSNGWMRIALFGEGHTIALRIDKARNKIWLFDPNIGYLSFKGANFEENQNQCLTCLQDLIKTHYSKLYGVSIYALKKLS